jgi:ATP-binding cassette, subfamily C, bacterial CydD
VTAGKRILALLAAPVSRQPVGLGLLVGANHPPLEPHLASIRFANVSYAYPEKEGDERWALNDISFEIRPGEPTVLIGPSGAGKSTILQLLLRFIEPASGQITVGERRLEAIPVELWRSQVAWAPQIPYLFNDTLLENLRLGKPKASPEEVAAALRLAHLDDFVHSLPQGLDTPCGENGARLSGGQVQRLALARAYLRDAPLLLLDEPGANLDPQQEAWLQDALAQLSQGRTVLTIAHRSSTIRRAKKVILLEHGRVIGSGSPQELAAIYPEFLATWQKHA